VGNALRHGPVAPGREGSVDDPPRVLDISLGVATTEPRRSGAQREIRPPRNPGTGTGRPDRPAPRTPSSRDPQENRMTTRRALTALIAVIALGVTACGDGGEARSAEPDRTVTVSMVDNKFAPAQLEVKEGETVRFAFTNDGTVDHEAIIGPEAVQKDHEAEMMAGDAGDDMGGMGHEEETPTTPLPSSPARPASSPTPSTRPASSSSAATSPTTTRPGCSPRSPSVDLRNHLPSVRRRLHRGRPVPSRGARHRARGERSQARPRPGHRAGAPRRSPSLRHLTGVPVCGRRSGPRTCSATRRT
jgi:plastocyanin